jgi:hypothetical protein
MTGTPTGSAVTGTVCILNTRDRHIHYEIEDEVTGHLVFSIHETDTFIRDRGTRSWEHFVFPIHETDTLIR